MIEKEKTKKAFDKALKEAEKLRGGVKAFMLLALTDEPSEERENAVIGINSVAGSLKDLVIIFNNISNDIKAAAALESMGVIMDNIINRKKKNEEE